MMPQKDLPFSSHFRGLYNRHSEKETHYLGILRVFGECLQKKVDPRGTRIVSFTSRLKSRSSFVAKCVKRLFSTPEIVADTKLPKKPQLTIETDWTLLRRAYIADLLGLRFVTKDPKCCVAVLKRLQSSLQIKVPAKRASAKWTWIAREDDEVSLFSPPVVRYTVDAKESLSSGYRGYHFDCIWEQSDEESVSFELQVKTPLQAAWSELTHDAVYKPDVRVRPLVLHRNAQLANTLRAFEEGVVPNLLEFDKENVRADEPDLLTPWERRVMHAIQGRLGSISSTLTYGELAELEAKYSYLPVERAVERILGSKSKTLDSCLKELKALSAKSRRDVPSLKNAIREHAPTSSTVQHNRFKGAWTIENTHLPYVEYLDLIARTQEFESSGRAFDLEQRVAGAGASHILPWMAAQEAKKLEAEPWHANKSVVALDKRDRKAGRLVISPGSYYDQIKTNMIVAEWIPVATKTLMDYVHANARKTLTPFWAEPRGTKNFLLNSIGIAFLVLSRDGIALLPRRSKSHGVMKSQVGPTVSWPMWWPCCASEDRRAWNMGIDEVIWEQFKYASSRELGTKGDDFERPFLSLCMVRELQRGGKPQIFGLVQCKTNATDLINLAQSVAKYDLSSTEWHLHDIRKDGRAVLRDGRIRSELSDEGIALCAMAWAARGGE